MKRTLTAGFVSLVVSGVCVLSLLLLPAAFSQQETPKEGERGVKKLEPVVVTGSLIPRAELVGATPVDVYTSEDIAKVGVQTVIQFLKSVPAYVGAGNFGESRGNGGDGSAAISLRGIDGGTLVLINGRRVATNQLQGLGNVDVNAIPLGAIERIEILKDGASALYGSDAQAGVVNIILKKKFTGTELYGSYGNTTDTDVGQQNYSFVTGLTNDKISLMLGGSYYKANALYSVDRSRSFPSPGNVSGTGNPGRIRTSNANDPADIIPSGGLFYTGAPGTTGTSLDQYRLWNSNTDSFPFPFYTPAIRPSERWSIFGTAEHALYDKYLTFFAEAMYTRTWSYNQLAPTPIVFAGTGPAGIVIPATNPYNLFGIPIDNMRYRTVELGPRTENNYSDNFRFVGGLKGQIGDTSWNWEAAFLYSQDDRTQKQGGELSAAALLAAVNDTSSLTAFNPFGNQANTQAQLERVAQTLVQTSTSVLQAYDAKLTGDLFEFKSGTVKAAVGAGYFEEKADYEPDAPTTFGDTVGFNSSLPFHAKRDVTSLFGEVMIPVFGKDARFLGVHSLEISGALRYDDYSDAGSTTNPKFTLRWQPIDETLTVRGSYGRSFTAPTFQSLYFQGQSFPELLNPFSGQFEQPTGGETILGNPNLKPEKGESYTLGFVYSPSYVKGLTVGIEYYRLKIKDRIGFSTQFLIDQNFLTGGNDPANPIVNGLFADLISFNVPIPGDPFNEESPLEYLNIDSPYLNLGQVKTDGFDINIAYVWPTERLGTFMWTLNATYITMFKRQTVPGAPFEDVLGDFTPEEADAFGFGSTPRLKGNLTQSWLYKQWEVGVTANYLHHYQDYKPALDEPRKIASIVTFDLQFAYNFPQDLRVTLGILNVFDREPPLAVGAFADNYDRDQHDLRQRFIYLSMLKKF